MLASQRATKGGRHQQETEPDRIFKLKECCDLLIACGYFRARMPNLTPFDKVVGGMVWSITASNVGVDVDLLFEENSTIGERIKLSENIVRTLIRMQCPTQIQSHQIQGLDYDHILLVLRWLVRKVIETRAITGDETRALSLDVFSHTYTHPTDAKPVESFEYIDTMSHKYLAQRKYKKKANAIFDSDVGRVEATLLEYEEKVTTVIADEETVDKKKEKGVKIDMAEQELLLEKAKIEEAKRLSELQNQLSSDSVASLDKISGNTLENLLKLRKQDLLSATETHTQQEQLMLEQMHMFASKQDKKKLEEQKHQRAVDNLTRRVQEATKLHDQYTQPYTVIMEKHTQMQTTLENKKQYLQELHDKIQELQAIEEDSENKNVLLELKKLVVLNETLKKQESEFKLACKVEMEELQANIAELSNYTSDKDAEKYKELKVLIKQDSEKYEKLRSLLAGKNQEIGKITRQIDEIPTRAELLQFERRFVELYDTVAAKMVETRQYYDLYNTLSNSYHYLQNQLTILESIVENFEIGMKTKQSQAQMISQFDAMMQGVEDSKKEVDSQLQEVKEEEDVLLSKYTKLIDIQREYFKTVKSFQEECTLNEKLSNALDKLTAMATQEE